MERDEDPWTACVVSMAGGTEGCNMETVQWVIKGREELTV